MSRIPNNDGFVSKGGAPETGEQAAMMPLMTGGGEQVGDGWNGGQDADGGVWGASEGRSEATGNPLLSHGSLLIVAIVLIAAGSLYAMRLTGGGLSADEATQQVEAKIEKYLTKFSTPGAMGRDDVHQPDNIEAMIEDTDEIIAVFNDAVIDRQVPVEYVAKNPFALQLVSDNGDEIVAVSTVDRDAAVRLKKLREQANKLTLQTVMNGPRPVAVISGEFYRKKDAVGDFIVATISPETQSVTLTAEGHEFELTMLD